MSPALSFEGLVLQAVDAQDNDALKLLANQGLAMPVPADSAIGPVTHGLFLTAFHLEQAGEVDLAISVYRRLVQSESYQSSLRANAGFRLGWLLESREAFTEALEAYSIATHEADDDNIRSLARYHTAALLERTGSWEEALDYLGEQSDGTESESFGLAWRLKRCTCLARLRRTSEIVVPAAIPVLSELETSSWLEAAAATDRAGAQEVARVFYERLLESASLPKKVRQDVGHRLRLLPRHAGELLGAVCNSLNEAEYQRAIELLDSAGAPSLVPSIRPEGQDLLLWFARIAAVALLGHFDHEQEEEVLAGNLPAPDRVIDDRTVALWTEAAFGLERAGHLPLARLFYGELLLHEEVPGPLRTNLHYRLGVVSDSLMDWDRARAEYEAAVASPFPFPMAQNDARLRLGEMDFAMDDFERAAGHFDAARHLPDLPSDRRAHAQLRYATCLLRSGQAGRAVPELEVCRLPGRGGGGSIEVKADLLLAEYYLQNKQKGQAAECFRRVVDHPASEPLTKAAALHQLNQIKR